MTTRNYALLPARLLPADFFYIILGFILAVSGAHAWADVASPNKTSSDELVAYQQAAAYSRAHRGLSMVIMKNGKIVFEDYAKGHTADEPHNLYSGTKSFSCAIAVAAIQDKLLSFDEPVSKTITEWQTDVQKSKITIHQLLTLTSGIDAGKTGSKPSYTEAIETEVLHAPGRAFQYGPIPFQIFGEVMRRKLAATGENPREYLSRRVLKPIGAQIDSWRTTEDGNPKMHAGAFLTAREWAKYGQLVLNQGRWEGKEILNKKYLSECSDGTAVNPGYGVTFWLPTKAGINSEGHNTNRSAEKLKAIHAPDLIIKAAGVGGQKLYVIPSQNLVVVRQASRLPLWGRGFEDAGFLAPLFKLKS